MGLYDPLFLRPTTLSQGFVRSDVVTPDGDPMYEFGIGFGLDGSTHTGVDVWCDIGDLVFSPVAGRVVIAGADGAYTDEQVGNKRGSGNLKIVMDGTGYEVILGHLRAIYPRVGERVAKGELVGVGGTYYGGHLHLEARVPDVSTTYKQLIVDPAILFTAPRRFRPVALLNARAGRLTTAPLLGQFTTTDVLDIVSVKRDARSSASAKVDLLPDLWGLTGPTAAVPNAWVYLPYTSEVR